MELKGRRIFGGKARGNAMVSREALSFFGGVNPDTGIIEEEGHPLQGRSVSGRVLVFPHGKGSTVGSYTLYRMKKTGTAPIAILNRECETIVAVGAIIAEIPCMDRIDIDRIPDDAVLLVDVDNGRVEVVANGSGAPAGSSSG
jgi:predicted aconitase with swiveling domain